LRNNRLPQKPPSTHRLIARHALAGHPEHQTSRYWLPLPPLDGFSPTGAAAGNSNVSDEAGDCSGVVSGGGGGDCDGGGGGGGAGGGEDDGGGDGNDDSGGRRGSGGDWGQPDPKSQALCISTS